MDLKSLSVINNSVGSRTAAAGYVAAAIVAYVASRGFFVTERGLTFPVYCQKIQEKSYLRKVRTAFAFNFSKRLFFLMVKRTFLPFSFKKARKLE